MEHDLAVEQAKLALAVQDARRELQSLVEEKDKFLADREEEAKASVLKGLKTVKDVLSETKQYTDAVESLRQEAERVVVELKEAQKTMQADHRTFLGQVREARSIIDNKTKELEESTTALHLNEMSVRGILKELELGRISLQVEQRKINDDRSKLATAMKIWQTQREITTE